MASPGTANHNGIGEPTITRKKHRFSWIWLVPIVAAIAGGLLVLRTWLEAGPTITITFATAEGLEAGKTQIRYKDVNVGQIQTIHLSEDRSHVITTASLAKEAASLAREGTAFWVVRPRLGLSGVSGLSTLLSGAYIGVDAPRNIEHPRAKTEFVGMEIPPEVTQDRAGKRFRLNASNLGSLDIGSPVYYRRISVGQVIGYQLSDDGQSVDIQIFVDAPNDRYVTEASRFWNASGVDFSLSADGLKVRTQSLLSVAVGGLAFEDIGTGPRTVAIADASYQIFDSEQTARAKPDSLALKISLRFDQSVRGLTVGAPVDFNGITLGQVDSIDIGLDNEKQRFYSVVAATIYPDRLGSVAQFIRKEYMGADTERPTGRLLEGLIKHGMRAQLRTGNLLTGQLYVAMDVFPNAPPVAFEMSIPANIPTVPNNLDQMQNLLLSIANKLDKIPFDKIGADLRTTLSTASRLMTRLDKQVAPDAQAALQEAAKSLAALNTLLSSDTGLVSNTDRTVQELTRTARSLRALSDYLQAHPEALIRGRAPDALPSGGGTRASGANARN